MRVRVSPSSTVVVWFCRQWCWWSCCHQAIGADSSYWPLWMWVAELFVNGHAYDQHGIVEHLYAFLTVPMVSPGKSYIVTSLQTIDILKTRIQSDGAGQNILCWLPIGWTPMIKAQARLSQRCPNFNFWVFDFSFIFNHLKCLDFGIHIVL